MFLFILHLIAALLAIEDPNRFDPNIKHVFPISQHTHSDACTPDMTLIFLIILIGVCLQHVKPLITQSQSMLMKSHKKNKKRYCCQSKQYRRQTEKRLTQAVAYNTFFCSEGLACRRSSGSMGDEVVGGGPGGATGRIGDSSQPAM